MNNKKEKRQQLWSDPKVQRYFSTKKREFFYHRFNIDMSATLEEFENLQRIRSTRKFRYL